MKGRDGRDFKSCWLTVTATWLLAMALCTCFVGVADAAKAKTRITSRHMGMCKGAKVLTSKRDAKVLSWMIEASGENSILLKSSPQHMAACWMLHKDRSKSMGRSHAKLLQRFALATLHFSTTQSNRKPWDWPMAVDEPKVIPHQGHWLSSKHHECSWYGVTCGAFRYVIQLDLGFLKLDGLLPRELALLTRLVDIDLHGNDLQGVIPYKITKALGDLEYLRLHMNGFFGAIHREILGMRSLKELHIFGNYFAGTIPTELAKLPNLEVIDAYANQLEGKIPTELARLKNLRRLDLHDNNLVGSVPKEICDMKLEELIVDCLGPQPEVRCNCCTVCCRGLPDFGCIEVETGKEVII